MHSSDRSVRDAVSARRVACVVVVAAILVQSAFVALAARATGHVDGFALRSVDGQEFMRLARSLADNGQFSQDRHAPFHPDTWRVPCYPLLLAGCIRLFGEGTLGPVLVQQVLAVCSVALLVLIASRWSSPRVAGIIGGLWLLDPYRGYYSLWILAGTLFVFLLLLGMWIWQLWWLDGRRYRVALGLGIVLGLAVLTRPIGVVVIPCALLGMAVVGGRPGQRMLRLAACLAGVLIVVGPWLVRNKVVAGHAALSHLTGVVLTYYKGVEVVLWSRGQGDRRYDEQAVHEIWESFDRRLRERWSDRYGLMTAEAARDVAWRQITPGRVRSVDQILLDREILRLGLAILAEHPAATVSCWFWRCVSIPVFPLSLVIDLPETPSALPFSGVLPETSASVRRIVAGILAAPFVVLTLLAVWRTGLLLWTRQFGLVAMWGLPVVALLLATSPQLDPRFRIPMIPFLLLIAVAGPGVSLPYGRASDADEMSGPRRGCSSRNR